MDMRRLLVVLALTAAALPGYASETDAVGTEQIVERTERIQQITNITGLVAGAGIGVLATAVWGFVGQDSIYIQGSDPWRLAVDIVPTFIAFTGATWFALRVFSDAMVALNLNPWLAAPVGAGFGLLAGAFVGAVGWTTMFAVGQPLGIVAVGEDSVWLRIVGLGLLSGAVWGGLTGIIPGLVLGPVIRIAVRY